MGRSMQRGIFITGTDTGVGKTYVAAGIAEALRAKGLNVGVMKPVETGCRLRSGKLIPADVIRLVRAASSNDPIALINPYRFRQPLAPAVAARFEGKRILVSRIMHAYRTLLRKHDFMIIEGAGGIMVPLTRNYLFLDLARSIGLPVMIVARPGLGTINHTLLTIDVLRERGISTSGVVINHTNKKQLGLAEETSPGMIEKISQVPVLGTVPYEATDFSNIVERLHEIVRR